MSCLAFSPIWNRCKNVGRKLWFSRPIIQRHEKVFTTLSKVALPWWGMSRVGTWPGPRASVHFRKWGYTNSKLLEMHVELTYSIVVLTITYRLCKKASRAWPVPGIGQFTKHGFGSVLLRIYVWHPSMKILNVLLKTSFSQFHFISIFVAWTNKNYSCKSWGTTPAKKWIQ